jgi:tetratricopeptide (TPR) repeat protein
LLGHPSLLADVLHLRGTLLYDKEVWATALEPALLCFEEALTLRQASDDLRGIAEGLFGIGIVFQNKIGATEDGQRKAFECFQESYRLAEQGGYASERAHAARHLAYLWTRRGDSDRALAYNLEFLKVNEELGFKPVLPPAYTMVGFAHLMRNQLDEAARCFETARLLAERAGYKRYLAEALFGMGATSEERGENDAALSCYEQALSLAQSINFQKVGELAAAKIDAILHDKGTT